MIYVAQRAGADYVHAFLKKAQQRATRDLDMAGLWLAEIEKAMVDRQSFESVWDALEKTPEAAAAMKMRSSLLMRLSIRSKAGGVTQAMATRGLGRPLWAFFSVSLRPCKRLGAIKLTDCDNQHHSFCV